MTDPTPTPSAPTATEGRRRNRTPDAEAATYRTRLREAETIRDARKAELTGQLAALHRDQVEHHLRSITVPDGEAEARTLYRPADLWEHLGATPGQFFDDTDTLDVDALTEFIAESTSGDGQRFVKVIEGYRPPNNTIANAAAAMWQRPPLPHERHNGGQTPWHDALRH